MTKQQPCASKLRLSKICRWFITLGIAKLAFLGVWSMDMPVPQLVFPDKNTASKPAPSSSVSTPADKQASTDTPTVALPLAQKTGEVRLAALFAEGEVSAQPKESAGRPLPERSPAEDSISSTQRVAKPISSVGEGAVRSAAPLPTMPVVHLPWSKAARADVETASAVNAGECPLASGVDADETTMPAARETAEGSNWWDEILMLTRLPVPILGVQRVAHAAVMDMPRPASRPATPGTSLFAPPEQAQVQSGAPIPSGQDPSGAPLPLRPHPSTSQAGAGTPPSTAAGMSVPPAPNTRAFLSPDSPESKQQDLARREQDVLMLKQQMDSRLQELQSAEKKVQGMLKEAHGVHDQKIKHLISSYTNMKPKQAALALESLDERLAVRILAGMNPKQAGEVLTYTNPKTVAKLTELLARMQLPGE